MAWDQRDLEAIATSAEDLMDRRARDRQPLALTRGDPSGIGPELALKAWLATHADEAAPPFLVAAEADHLAALAKSLRLAIPIECCDALRAADVFPRALPVLESGSKVAGGPGAPDVRDAAATIASIETCVRLVHKGEARAVVTSPIAKEVLYRAGFAHPGHTEFLAELARQHFGVRARPVMLLWSPELAVVPATIHVPLAEVPRLLSRELLLETGLIVAKDYQRRFRVLDPRLAFTGLNPHAGEAGAMGREEVDIISPALADLSAAGVKVSGPNPADTLFHRAARQAYDVVIAMYHDQALIPIKTLAFESAVNVTLGLPYVRTSPDHGTAFDIAGKGIADPQSLIAAIRLADRLTQP